MNLRLAISKKSRALRRLALGTWMLSWSTLLVFGATLEFSITPTFSNKPIQTDSFRYETAARESFSITRVSYLVSGFALQCSDGSWLERTNDVAWFDVERARSMYRMSGVPSGEYRAVRFYIGLDEAQNHSDPAQYPGDHALNPNFNGLHWNWQGGYVFLALEGLWRNKNGELDGWSYHFAREANRTSITFPTLINLTNKTRVELDFDIAALLNGSHSLSFTKDGSTTRSQAGDPISNALRANLPGAFLVKGISVPEPSEAGPLVKAVKPIQLPGKFTPVRFQMSSLFPIPDLPRDNPLIEERVVLGAKLFRDTALSKDNSISCASCHDDNHAFSDPKRFSTGVRSQTGMRNAMPLFNLAWKSSYFWDGRAPSLRTQALMPIQDHMEMDESLTNVVAKLSSTSDYPALFSAAFAPPGITSERIGLALEQFLLTLVSFDSKFDQSLRGEVELNASEKRGFELFMTEYDPRREQYGADCFHCHGGLLFQSQTFANNGLDTDAKDNGRAKITGRSSDRAKFSAPSLRNVALTAPYMHDGRFATLEDVIEHYSEGVKRSDTLDPNLAKHPNRGLHLDKKDKEALVAFLRTLTDARYLK